jgi:cytoskeletal protein CcmA (bactofilin family)
MAFFAKGRERGRRTDPTAGCGTAEPTPREVDMFDRDRAPIRGGEGALAAFLGKGTRVTGTLVLEGPSRLEGYVEGHVSARDALTVGEGAVVNARIEGTTIVIEGTVTGDVVAATRLELRPPAKLTGDVTTPSLVVEEGAVFDGRCSMRAGESAEEARPTPATATAEPTRHAG